MGLERIVSTGYQFLTSNSFLNPSILGSSTTSELNFLFSIQQWPIVLLQWTFSFPLALEPFSELDNFELFLPSSYLVKVSCFILSAFLEWLLHPRCPRSYLKL